jgi:ATP-dependent RNA helicase RhlE
MSFTTFGLSDHILKGVQAAGYTTPTPIQERSLLPALAGKDILGCAQTGTGKTAAFVLPLLQRLSAETSNSKHPRALVLTPTRELAQQVHDAVRQYGRFLHLRTLPVYGGVGIGNQLTQLRRGTDIVIATPGRLLDHLQQKSIDLSGIKILVLDEADRMLDMGFINDVRKIIARIPQDRQTMMFSATMGSDIEHLANDFLRNHELIEAGERRKTVQAITQHFYSVAQDAKMSLLIHALEKEKMESVLVFSRTKHGADKISRRLDRQGISSMAIHSNRTQAQRQRALDGFKEGRFRVLVATDIAARGIDVDGISHVVNYDIPHYAEDYVHRIGRTGRAGATGDAVTFVTPEDRQHLRRIEQFTGQKHHTAHYPGFTPPKPAEGPAIHRAPFAPVPAAPGQRPAIHRRADGRRPAPVKPRVPGQQQPGRKYAKPQHPQGRRKRQKIEFGRKRKPVRKLDSFSSDHPGAWSNY